MIQRKCGNVYIVIRMDFRSVYQPPDTEIAMKNKSNMTGNHIKLIG